LKDAALRQSRFPMAVYPGSLKISETFLAGSERLDSVARLIQRGFLTKQDREKLIAMSTQTSELHAITSPTMSRHPRDWVLAPPAGLLQIECFFGKHGKLLALRLLRYQRAVDCDGFLC
jgi:hypothetical protein